MSDEERIESLVKNPPKVESTPQQRAYRAAAVLFGAVATVALVLSLVGMARIGSVASCTNNNLGSRNGPSARDAQAHIAFGRAIEALFLPRNATQAQREYAAKAFKRATHQYVQALAKDQQYRATHPLGRC